MKIVISRILEKCHNVLISMKLGILLFKGGWDILIFLFLLRDKLGEKGESVFSFILFIQIILFD